MVQTRLRRGAAAKCGSARFPCGGKGAFSFPPLMDALRSVGYEGYVTVHQASAELGTEAAVRESARYLKRLLATN